VGLLKLTNTYDILDPETQTQLGIAKEKPGVLTQIFRLILGKQLLPTQIFIYEGSDPEDQNRLLFSIRRGFTLLSPRIEICDSAGAVAGVLKRKFFSWGGAFRVYDTKGQEVAQVKGDWKGWNFRFLDSTGIELGTITKKWAGIGKELFTSADNYIISLNQRPDPTIAMLLLAAGLAVDTVFKETNG
jgi:uncharacterized protein YxjI